MDLISKYRLIGASIWLGLLVIIVPSWYSDPVNFQPDGAVLQHNKSTLPVIEQPFRLPAQAIEPRTDAEQQREAIKLDMASVAASEESQRKQQALDKLSETLASLNKDDAEKSAAKQAHVENKTPVTAKSIAPKEAASPQWILRLSSFSDIKDANDLLGKLDLWGYEAKIKYFEKSKVYSVRTGPYFSRAKADKDKAKLDKMLRTNGVVVESR
ncbi:SPOR domain-containing protein [Thiomicrorhabdus sediminis]|uniref:SPOR domain-containing protein n=1 Tax=Thiomicrorhabdus sediminis TaxID=2580412 RepID=A0A4P9K4A0_9GAMM|nr:SPOR domain-containing protein [Thiomicrorhabdus sediminis]QCU89752.1 hypothetical protein FE785_03410 [Thiomicrorhabdus sediminis]